MATPNTKLWLDGTLIVDNTVNQDTQRGPKTIEMPLQKGHGYVVAHRADTQRAVRRCA